MFSTVLAAKIISSGAIVLGLSLLAEHVGPRVAGVLSGAPLGAVLVYFFLGRDTSPDLIVESIPYGIAGLTGTLVFVFVYYRTSLWFSRFGYLYSPALAVAAFIAVALPLRQIPFTLVPALALTVCASILAGLLFRSRIENLRISWRVRMTPQVIALRVGLSTFFVVSIVEVAKILGPAWAGLLIGFPMTLLPFLMIVHMTYSCEHAHALIRNFPIGMGGLIIYLISVSYAFPIFGIVWGTAVSLCTSVLYLIGLSFLWKLTDKIKLTPPAP